MAFAEKKCCAYYGIVLFLVIIPHVVSPQAVVSGFVKIVNGHFVDNDDSPFLFNGFNSYWMMHVAADPTQRYKISNVFQQASNAGLHVCRTWAFSDGGDQPLQISPGVYDERVFQALDFVVAEARKHGVRLILSLTNNYKDFGGRPQYVKWAEDAAGLPVPTKPSEDGFYTNSVVKGYYKNHVERVLTRNNTITGVVYKDEPAIMAWELMNEPRCDSDNSGRTVNAWVQEMASHVKSIDNKHLLEIGMEGFYGDSIQDRKQFNPGYQVGTDFVTNNLIKEIDFSTIHAYPDIWLSSQNESSQFEFTQRWLTSHMMDSRTLIKKPLVFTEFGKKRVDSGSSSISARDAFLNNVYDSMYNLARQVGTIAGGLVWQVMAEGMEPYYDGYEIILSRDVSTTRVIRQQALKMTALEHRLHNRPHVRRPNNRFSKLHENGF